MNNLQPPQIFSDLYRDLRDRRLLIPVLGLVVAIIAVPVVLGGPEPVPPPSQVAVTGDRASAFDSAVLVAEPGIRNYGERLAALKSKNPFDQKFALPDASPFGGDPAADPTGAAAADTGAAVAAGGVADTAGSSTEAPIDTGPPSDTSPVSPDAGAGEPSAPAGQPAAAEPPPPEIRFYAGRVDVVIGPIGQTKLYEDVRYLNFLPDDNAPVVAFLGLLEGGDRAVFSISSDVDIGKGDGSCAPKKPDPCQFLTLKVGDVRYLNYGLEGTAYRLKLIGADVVRVPDPREPVPDAAADSE